MKRVAPLLPSHIDLPQDRTLVMGVLNVTPDSFSDGGAWNTPTAAVERAQQMLDEGADIIDVGGESTRPHSVRISADKEWERIGGIVSQLASQGVAVSVDTMHHETVRRAADAGAAIINDVSGGMRDPQMNVAVAATSCAYVVQRYHALPGEVAEHFDHGDVVATILQRQQEQVDRAIETGVDPARIITDPGLGFSLNPQQCWEIVENTHELSTLGYPVLIGASRKRFLAASDLHHADELTAQVSAQVATSGVWAVRVHNVAVNVAAIQLALARGV